MCLILLCCFVFLGSPEQLSSPIHGQINVASDREQQRVRCFMHSIHRNYNFIVSSCKSLPDLKIFIMFPQIIFGTFEQFIRAM